MKEKTAAFEDKADKNHHFLSEVYAATISKEANYKIQVLNTSSIETVKTREGHFYRFASFFRLFICRFKINAYLCGGSGQSFVPGRNSRTGIFPVFLFIHKAFVSIFDNYYSVSLVLNTSSIETVKTRGEEIEEVWIRERYGSLTLLYKKRTAG